ncbi:hypothetical protein GCM10009830_39920 [Glycomyces endophyticus]|uniref:Heme-binding protein n=1 Tax=Glycomyces endophyticus TaxID=480996 RepID=A0ABN2HI63_9ACTN
MRPTLQQAEDLTDAALKAGAALGKALSVAVVDEGGYTVLVKRADGARPITPQIAQAKAYSAAVMERPSAQLRNWADSNPVFFNQVAQMGHQPIVPTEGGIPVKLDGRLIGGLGISGGTPDEDERIARETLAGLGYELDFAAWGQPGTKAV